MAAGVPNPQPVDPKVRLTNILESLGRDPNAIDQLTEVDEIRRAEFKSAMTRAQRERYPVLKKQKEARALQIVERDIAYFIGASILGGLNLTGDQKTTHYVTEGSEYIADTYNLRRE